MGKSTLKRGMVIYRFAWSSYHVQCLFLPCTMSISNPSFLSMIRPLTAQCSCTPDYRLSIKIALLSAGPALGGVFTLCLQQNHWNMCLLLNSTSIPWYSPDLGLLGASLIFSWIWIIVLDLPWGMKFRNPGLLVFINALAVLHVVTQHLRNCQDLVGTVWGWGSKTL